VARRPRPWWKRLLRSFKHLVAYALVRALFSSADLVPERVLFALGRGLGRALWYTPLRGLLRANIRAAYGIEPPSAAYPTVDALARGSLEHLGLMLAEVLMLDRWQPRLMERCVAQDDLAGLGKRLLAQGRGLILATGHLGNWELMGRAIALAGFEVNSLARAAFDPKVADWLVAWRARGGVRVVNRGSREAVRTLRERLRAGAGLGVLVDVDTKVSSVWVPFFGRLAKTPTAAADLALKMDAPLMVAWTWRERPGLYSGSAVEVPVQPTGDREADVRRITAEVTAILERAIRAHPEQWVWVHRRFKSPPPPPPGGGDTSQLT
jgi:KDO2-lipid IV(A) lauroyltransferase